MSLEDILAVIPGSDGDLDDEGARELSCNADNIGTGVAAYITAPLGPRGG